MPLLAATVVAIVATACLATVALARHTRPPGPAEKVFPFGRSSEQYRVPAGSVPRFWADGRSCSVGCRPGGSAAAWPLKPFHRQHALRAGLNERRDTTFHVGIDIQAFDRQAVYSLQSGRAHIIAAGGPDSRVQVGNFIYWHIRPRVGEGQRVQRLRTVVGIIKPRFRHLHLSELRGRGDAPSGNLDARYLNPLRPGGRVLAPWHETAAPVIGRPEFRAGGRVFVSAFDPQSFRVRTDYETPVLAPAALAYTVTRDRARRQGRVRFALRGSQHLAWSPAVSRAIWAPGARKAGYGCYATRVICRPRWRYVLAGGLAPALDPRRVGRGDFRLTVYAWDWAGNVSGRDALFEVTASGRIRPYGLGLGGGLKGPAPHDVEGPAAKLRAASERPAPPRPSDRG